MIAGGTSTRFSRAQSTEAGGAGAASSHGDRYGAMNQNGLIAHSMAKRT